ncbi:helix-turn-helix domain-containing protein [Nocardia sp. NPDC050175]|uniref:helix-turn-helix domain-containing protein n=1 Tax=Nocardia sp. NPDC050175 TaxID=3364317 RepID=UPI0037ADE3DC
MAIGHRLAERRLDISAPQTLAILAAESGRTLSTTELAARLWSDRTPTSAVNVVRNHVPALAQAAKNLADRRLADPELSPTVLARELNVSVRTLQRAFAAEGESVAAYIQHRRLQEARLALTSRNRLSVSELAAYWQFSDRSHFIRAFKKAYGLTPAEYARAAS